MTLHFRRKKYRKGLGIGFYMGAVEDRILGLRPFEILVFIIALVLLGLCLTVIPSVSSDVEDAIREDIDARNTKH